VLRGFLGEFLTTERRIAGIVTPLNPPNSCQVRTVAQFRAESWLAATRTVKDTMNAATFCWFLHTVVSLAERHC